MRYTALLFICGSVTAQTAEPSLTVGYFELAPHTLSSDKLRAPALCYFDLLAAKMQYKVQYQAMPLSRLIQQLANNQLDLALILAKSPERQQLLVYPATALFATTAALAVRSELSADIHSFMRQADYSIILWQQCYQTQQLKNFAGRTISLTGDNIPARAVEMLQKKRADAFYEPDLYSLQYELDRYDLTKQLKILPFTDETLPLYSAFSKQAAPHHLVAYEKALSSLQAQLPYLTYLQSYLSAIKQQPDLIKHGSVSTADSLKIELK